MESSEQRKTAFIKDLKELLNKHGAELSVEEVGARGYMPGTWVVNALLNSVYGEDEAGEYECLKAYTDISLGTFIDGKDE
jgi:hypothetical protein